MELCIRSDSLSETQHVQLKPQHPVQQATPAPHVSACTLPGVRMRVMSLLERSQ